MSEHRHPIPDWVTKGKTIRQLIKELSTFEDQDMEARISLDYGDTSRCISIVAKQDGHCILQNAEAYHEGEWQEFMDGSGDAKK